MAIYRKTFTMLVLFSLALTLLIALPPAAYAATLTVGGDTYTCDEAGLDAAVSAARTGDTIDFDDGCTNITLTSTSSVSFEEGITIDGGGTVTIDGNGNGGVFEVFLDDVDATLTGLTITNGRIDESNVADGGGIHYSGMFGTLNIVDSTITNNQLNGRLGLGSGVFVDFDTTLIVVNSTITGNQSNAEDGADGSGIYNQGTLVVTDSVISGNAASATETNQGGNGAGIFNRSSAQATIVNSVISGNSVTGARGRGGGIYNDSDVTFTVINSTIVGNSATDSGGGIYNDGTLTLTNSIVANSTAGGDVEESQSITFNGSNIVGDNSATGANITNGEPLLDADLVPQIGSPAIDAGDNSLALDADGNPLTIDLARNARIFNGTVDIGAFEYTLDTTPPDAPVIVSYTNDTGSSSSDNITNDDELTITGTAEANSTVTVTSAQDGEVGSTTADSSGDWTVTTRVLSENAHSLTVTATDAFDNTSDPSTALTVTVDSTAPTAVCNDWNARYNDSDVTITPQDIDDGSTDANGIATLALDISTFTAINLGTTVIVTLLVLDVASNISTCTGEVYVTIPADVNSDGFVTPADAIFVINRLNTSDTDADVDNSGTVDKADVQAVIDEIGVTVGE